MLELIYITLMVKSYFGEMTFYHHCGFVPFDPEEWDYTFGNSDKDLKYSNS